MPLKYSALFISLILFSTASYSDKKKPIEYFKPDSKTITGHVKPFSDEDLCSVATETQNYLSLGYNYDQHSNHAGIFKELGISVYKIKKTLDFICKVSLEDSQKNQRSRLHDLNFLQTHFDIIRWYPNITQAQQFKQQKTLLKRLPVEQILLTRYYVKKAQGSLQPSADKPYALYALPYDENGLSLEQADKKQKSLTRFQYTKQDILNGVIDKHELAKPLVYLSREDLEDTLMQGTVMVDIKGKSTFFNVHRNNNHNYDRNRNKYEQKRYWYFKETPGSMGYGKDANHKITVKPKVTVAGDLKLLGLGKLILLSSPDARTKNKKDKIHRLVILADTGGAFKDNAYQLDFLSGYYHNWADYQAQWKHLSDYAEVRFLILKEK